MSLNEGPEQPRIGVDEWVASSEERRARSLTGRVQGAVDRAPAAVKLVALVVPFAVFPLFVDSQYLMQVGIDTLIFVLLALGLNVAVGWVGLLDLGYVAFFGIGSYLYAAMASEYAGRHWDAAIAIPLIAVAAAVSGFLVGLPSRRLVGDYLAIVTLFFLQLWLVVLINASWSRGPNGISDLYPLEFFGRQVISLDAYYYVALIAFVLIISFLYLLNLSRTGRAWRALREDELAAELMTMPVSRLKLMGFAVGAGIAGVAGAIFAPVQGAVFPANFDLVLLITLYAMVVLGGAGTLVGVTVGAVLINASLEALRDADNASWIFYGVVALALIALLRPWWQPIAVLGATVVFGFVVHGIAEQARPSLVEGATFGESRIDGLVDSWVLLPQDIVTEDGLPAGWLARVAYIGLVAAVLGLTLISSRLGRLVGLVPVLYLAACVWANLLIAQPAVARFVLIGAMLVGLMAYRPEGLFGKQRVEII
ncbi:MAG: branched-chain amino acid ABC transporter permease [Actinobacteria bacterium]|nr:branched-chain amino acid ABC transporter permease [Actinomycetota bacterium]